MKHKTNKRGVTSVLILLLVIAVSFIAGLSSDTFGGEVSHAYTVDDNYYFNRIDVEINVNRDKTFDICETLKVQFREDDINTGIIRHILRLSRTTRIVDGKKDVGRSYIAGLDNVEVTLDGEGARVTQSVEGDFYDLKMQTPHGYISSGEHVFVLKYTYDMSDDISPSGYDDFTFDVLGYAMAYTNAFSAKIIFPEGTDLSDVTFRTNDKKAWIPDSGNLESARIEGNVIRVGALPRAANRGYTVQVILPKGYFSQKLTYHSSYTTFAVLSLVSAVAVIVLFIISVVNRKIFAPVEYLPPSDMSIMEVSAVWHKGARYKDIGALVLQWAAKGLVSIEFDGRRNVRVIPDPSLNSPEGRERLEKELKYDELNLFNALMHDSTGYWTFSTSQFKKLGNVFVSKQAVYDASEKIVENADVSKPPKVTKGALMRLIPIASLIPTFAMMFYYCALSSFDIILAVICMIFALSGTFAGTEFNKNKIVALILFPLVFCSTAYVIFMEFVLSAYDYAYLLYIAPAWWAVCLFVLPHFVKGIRSKNSKEDYRRLYGFRNYLLLTELDRIRLVFDENPDFFAEVLPYCVVMGISKKVQKRFAALEIKVPPYLGDVAYASRIGSCIGGSCHNTSVSLTFRGSGGGGGGGGSGGSSGGGGGGGGSSGC